MVEVFKGRNGQIQLDELGVTITRKGVLGFITQGLKGEKRIPYASISAVQFKEAGLLTAGYIQLSILGGVEAKGGIFNATQDENTVMFDRGAQAAEFAKIRALVEQRAAAARRPAAASLSVSVADELGKLATLLSQGVLTQVEFDAQKASLLARA